MSTSIVSDECWAVVAAKNPSGRETAVSEVARPDRKGRPRKMMGLLDDVVLLLLVVFLAPLAILVIGTPVALCVRLLIEIAQRL